MTRIVSNIARIGLIASIIARIGLVLACAQLLLYPAWESSHSILADEPRHDVWPIDEWLCVLVIGLHAALLATHVLLKKRSLHIAMLALAALGTYGYYWVADFLTVQVYQIHYVSVALQTAHLVVTACLLWLPRIWQNRAQRKSVAADLRVTSASAGS